MIIIITIKKIIWGLGIGDWGLGPIPNPQSPIPNSEVYNFTYYSYKYNILLLIFLY